MTARNTHHRAVYGCTIHGCVVRGCTVYNHAAHSAAHSKAHRAPTAVFVTGFASALPMPFSASGICASFGAASRSAIAIMMLIATGAIGHRKLHPGLSELIAQFRWFKHTYI